MQAFGSFSFGVSQEDTNSLVGMCESIHADRWLVTEHFMDCISVYLTFVKTLTVGIRTQRSHPFCLFCI